MQATNFQYMLDHGAVDRLLIRHRIFHVQLCHMKM